MQARPLPPKAPGLAVDGHERTPLSSWLLVGAAPESAEPDLACAIDADAPGTVAQALLAADLETDGIDERDWWYACRMAVPASEDGVETVLHLDGLATEAEVWAGGRRLLESSDMFLPASIALDGHAGIEAGGLRLVFRALAPVLARKHPRPRWKTRVVAEQSLRWHRTMLLGRCPGFAPGPPTIGPWRPVSLERRRLLAVDACRIRPLLLDDGRARLDVRLGLRELGASIVSIEGRVGGFGFPLVVTRGRDAIEAIGTATARLAPWWPSTHGDPALHELSFHVRTSAGDVEIDAGRVGFRRVEIMDPDRFAVVVNGIAIFCRGGAFMPDPVTVDHARDRLDALLTLATDAGMNMLRLPGLGAYASDELLDRCDELGLLVWQDFTFANMDYPVDDPGFGASSRRRRPPSSALPGGTRAWRSCAAGRRSSSRRRCWGSTPDFPLLDAVLPWSAGGDRHRGPIRPVDADRRGRAFRPRVGVAHYFGVGAYLRPLRMRAAPACGSPPSASRSRTCRTRRSQRASVSGLLSGWQASRETTAPTGTSRTFATTTSVSSSGVDPGGVRRDDPERYLELSRVAAGEVVAETFGEWRRAGSPCSGALLWCLNDMRPGRRLGDRRQPRPAEGRRTGRSRGCSDPWLSG